jgi:hypothetical protein
MTGWILTSTEPEYSCAYRRGEQNAWTDGSRGFRGRCGTGVPGALPAGICPNEEQLTVEDLGSTNGTLVNGERVDQSVLRTGDTLTVGRVTFTITPA